MQFTQPTQITSSSKINISRLLLPMLWLFAIGLGIVHTWAAITSQSMNADGINYLDIGDAYVTRNWQAAINTVWSPLYSWILGPILALVKPSMDWEFPLVQLVNFGIYILTLISFTFFWRQLTHFRQMKLSASSGSIISFPYWAWISIGYLLFIWSALTLIELWSVTPDMLMATFVFIAAGLILRIRLGDDGYRILILLGFILGLGYLTKTIMFPLGFAFILAAILSLSRPNQNLPKVILTIVTFLIICGSFIGLISVKRGTLTFGDAGKLTYARHVNGVPYPHWQGRTSGNGIPIQPTRQISINPPIYEFSSPIGGTYPVSYDPSYWYEGVQTRFNLVRQVEVLFQSGIFYYDLFLRQLGILTAGMVILYLGKRSRSLSIYRFSKDWNLLLPSIVAFALYSPVLVEGRYIAAFVVLLFGVVLANFSLNKSSFAVRVVFIFAAVAVCFMFLNIAVFNLKGFGDLRSAQESNEGVSSSLRSPSRPGEVTKELNQLGLEPGVVVGVIGYAFDSYWARLGRFKIIAEMLESDAEPFWTGDPNLRADVLSAFESTGVRAVVAEHVPNYANLSDWHQVSDSNYYIYMFTP